MTATLDPPRQPNADRRGRNEDFKERAMSAAARNEAEDSDRPNSCVLALEGTGSPSKRRENCLFEM